MNRRDVLRGGIAFAVGSPVVLNEGAKILSQRERLEAAVEELKAAAIAAHPDLIQTWTVKLNPEMGCPVLIAGFSA